jgi:hypothetical protein
MFSKATSTKFFAPYGPEGQDAKRAKKIIFLFSKNLASFAPWNTDSTMIKLFAPSAIPQGELSFVRL